MAKEDVPESVVTLQKVTNPRNGLVWLTNKSCPFASRLHESQHVFCGTWCPLCSVNSIRLKDGAPTGIKMSCGSGITHDVKVKGKVKDRL
jgi:hypothetical protein